MVQTRWRVYAVGLLALVPSFGLMAGARAQDMSSPTVVAIPDSALGARLVDPDGWTLYTWAGDTPDTSNCTDRCALEWPPLLSSDGVPIPPDGLNGALGAISRPDGTLQVTYDDAPLYYYRDDGQPGDTRGDGKMDAGAVWSLAAEAGVAPASGAAPALPVASGSLPAAPTAVALPPAIAPPRAVPSPAAIPTAVPRPTAPLAPAAPSSVTVAIQNFAFQPPAITVKAGGSIQWSNHDNVAHTATGGSFSTGPIAPGSSASQTFSSPGQFTYHCTIHPGMTGTITVV